MDGMEVPLLMKQEEVRIWEEAVTLPTYEVGKPDKNPMFLEKRVYQGSSGRVYPYPVVDKIEDEKVDKMYHAVYLENRYLKVMVLPELGGRIHRAIDKTNNYDFVYYNHVVKPALVGLAGPWISGGIEFNWPQHHRPNTYGPVEHAIRENADGSKTLFVSEIDRMYGTKGMAAFTLYPDKAYIEIKGQLYNRTSASQTFLWWANPAVPANENTQSIFPPDVHAVFDHGKRDVSKFPIATGTYYKMDYSAGVDISRFQNIKVPTSYMAQASDYDFVGGYDHGKQAGILHVADHHVSPGKKQWTWGSGDFGKAWDRNPRSRRSTAAAASTRSPSSTSSARSSATCTTAAPATSRHIFCASSASQRKRKRSPARRSPSTRSTSARATSSQKRSRRRATRTPRRR